MFDDVLKYLQFGNLFCGIEHTSAQGEELLRATLLRKKKKELLLEEVFDVSSLEALAEKIPKKIPVFLVINNEQVLTKQLENPQAGTMKAINRAFPNINLDDFYYETIGQEKSGFVFLCRKKYVDGLIEQYTALKIHLLDFSLGNAIITTLTEFIEQPEIATSNATIELENKAIINIEKNPQPANKSYKINGLETNNRDILSLSAGLNTILDNYQREINFNDKGKLLSNDYFHLRFFSLFSKFSLIFILGLLLINFLFFNHYYKEVELLQQSSQSNQALKAKVTEMDQDLGQAQKMVENILRGNSSKSALYVNDIVQNLPFSILLSELDFQPLSKRIKEGEMVELNQELILVSGQSSKSKSFSEWLKKLNALKWVKKVEVRDYADIDNSLSEFKIAIILKK